MNVTEPTAGQSSRVGRAPLIGLVTVVELVVLLTAFVPLLEASTALDKDQAAEIRLFWWTMSVTRPGAFVLVTLAGGALGGALHAIASLTAHVAAGDFVSSWTMWYLANPIVGAALATIFLFVLQAGLGGQASPTGAGLYGIAGFATLVGLFTRHALRKLRDIFDVVFVTQKRPPASQREPGAGGGA